MVKLVAMLLHGRVEDTFSRVAKRRMPHVMHQRQCFYQIFIQLQLRGNRPRNLCYLNRMREPVAEMVRTPASKDLGLIFQTAECPRVHHAIAITLKVVAIGMASFRITPSMALLGAQRVRGKHEKSLPQRLNS